MRQSDYIAAMRQLKLDEEALQQELLAIQTSNHDDAMKEAAVRRIQYSLSVIDSRRADIDDMTWEA